jgi:hypothetical protein
MSLIKNPPSPPFFKGGNLKSPFVKGRFRGILPNVLYPTLTGPWILYAFIINGAPLGSYAKKNEKEGQKEN